jgi:hypothetical protein
MSLYNKEELAKMYDDMIVDEFMRAMVPSTRRRVSLGGGIRFKLSQSTNGDKNQDFK